MAVLSQNIQSLVDQFVGSLVAGLGDNLYSCILYGSTVRGDYVPDTSDVNILIILNVSTSEAHTTIAELIGGRLRIDPFIIGRPGMERSFRAFALKIRSIQRDYRVLHGADPLSDFTIDDDFERFICEQSLRNLRLRLVHAYVMLGKNNMRYTQFLIHWTPTLFVDLSEAIRLEGIEIPHDFDQRVTVLGDGFKTDTSVLSELLNLKKHPREFSNHEVVDIHARVYRLLTEAVRWVELRWPIPDTLG